MRCQPALRELETLKKFNQGLLSALEEEFLAARTAAKQARVDLRIQTIHQQQQDIDGILNVLRASA